MTFLRWYLWVAPNLLITVCLFGLWRRALARRFPFFFTYCAVEFAGFLALLSITLLIVRSHATLQTYRWGLLFTTGAVALLEIAVLYELANHLILSRSTLILKFRATLRWVLAVLILVGAASSALFTNPGIDQLMRAFQALDFFASVIALGLMLALLAVSQVLQISWRSLPFGIVLGFGIAAATEMSASALISGFGGAAYINIDLVRMAAFHISALIWCFYTLMPEKISERSGQGLNRHELDLWTQELQRMVRR